MHRRPPGAKHAGAAGAHWPAGLPPCGGRVAWVAAAPSAPRQLAGAGEGRGGYCSLGGASPRWRPARAGGAPPGGAWDARQSGAARMRAQCSFVGAGHACGCVGACTCAGAHAWVRVGRMRRRAVGSGPAGRRAPAPLRAGRWVGAQGGLGGGALGWCARPGDTMSIDNPGGIVQAGPARRRARAARRGARGGGGPAVPPGLPGGAARRPGWDGVFSGQGGGTQRARPSSKACSFKKAGVVGQIMSGDLVKGRAARRGLRFQSMRSLVVVPAAKQRAGGPGERRAQNSRSRRAWRARARPGSGAPRPWVGRAAPGARCRGRRGAQPRFWRCRPWALQ
jgi:hypothetical protein